MKLKLACTLLIIFALTGCGAKARTELPPTVRLSQLRADQPFAAGNIKLVRAVNSIRQGRSGTLTIQGQPGTVYNAAATYRIGDKLVTTVESKTSDADGYATWNWPVSSRTEPGTYPITISGGGKTLITQYAVIP